MALFEIKLLMADQKLKEREAKLIRWRKKVDAVHLKRQKERDEERTKYWTFICNMCSGVDFMRFDEAKTTGCSRYYIGAVNHICCNCVNFKFRRGSNPIACRCCFKMYPSRNRLFEHLFAFPSHQQDCVDKECINECLKDPWRPQSKEKYELWMDYD